MSWFNVIGDVFSGGKSLINSFTEDKEQKAQREHKETMGVMDQDMASLKQFSTEFFERKNQSWWDSFIDGLNRLPRPLISLGVLSFFVLAPLYPEKFIEIVKVYQIIPLGYWGLLSVIIGFYFGGRMQLKAQDMKIKKEAVDAVKRLMAAKNGSRQSEFGEQSDESEEIDVNADRKLRLVRNKVIDAWSEDR